MDLVACLSGMNDKGCRRCVGRDVRDWCYIAGSWHYLSDYAESVYIWASGLLDWGKRTTQAQEAQVASWEKLGGLVSQDCSKALASTYLLIACRASAAVV